MLRSIAIVTLVFLAMTSFFAPLADVRPGTVLIGGEYTVQPGEVRHGDLLAVFAQVKVAAGGNVDGQVIALGGELEVAGSVAENVRSFGSKLTVSPAAQIAGKVNSVGLRHGWFLLPSILLVVS